MSYLNAAEVLERIVCRRAQRYVLLFRARLALAAITVTLTACHDNEAIHPVAPLNGSARSLSITAGDKGAFDADVSVESRITNDTRGAATRGFRYHLSRVRTTDGWKIVMTTLEPRLLSLAPRVTVPAERDVARIEIDETTGERTAYLGSGEAISSEFSRSHFDSLGPTFRAKMDEVDAMGAPSSSRPQGRHGLSRSLLLRQPDIDAMHARLRAALGSPSGDQRTIAYHGRARGQTVEYLFDRSSGLPISVSVTAPDGRHLMQSSTYMKVDANTYVRTHLHSEVPHPNGSGTLVTDISVSNVRVPTMGSV